MALQDIQWSLGLLGADSLGKGLGSALNATGLTPQARYQQKLSDLAGQGKYQEASGLAMGQGDERAGLSLAQLYQAAQPKPTDDQREYAQAQKQGYKGTLLDYQQALKKAGASSNTVNVAAGENAFNKKVGEDQAKRYGEIVTAGDQANVQLGDLNALSDIGTRLQTGKQAEITGALGPYIKALGIDVKGLDDIQAFDAIQSRLAQGMRTPGAGATSDFDAQQFLKQVPNLRNTPEGNKLVSDTMTAIAQNKRTAANIARAAMSGNLSREAAEAKLQALPDPFTAWKKANPAPAQSAVPAAPQQQNVGQPPQGIDPGLWQHMTPEERALWNSM